MILYILQEKCLSTFYFFVINTKIIYQKQLRSSQDEDQQMWNYLRKVFNIFSIFMMVLSALCLGIWGFFKVDILPALMGEGLSTFFYCAFGVLGLYGVHLFVEYSKLILNPSEEKKRLMYEVETKRTYEDQ